MSKRNNVVRRMSESVQGEGSWVDVRKLSWGVSRDLALFSMQQGSGKPTPELMEKTEATILAHLVAWNWVDENGTPMPLPTTVDDMRTLTEEEMNFLTEAVFPPKDKNPGDAKN